MMIKLSNLQKVVDQRTVVDIGVLGVGESEIAALVGPTGSGNSTLFELLIGRSKPSTGEVRLVGVNPAVDQIEFSRVVGVLFPENALYKNQSAKSNLVFYRRLHGLPGSRVDDVLAQVGLADQAKSKVDTLSPGLKRRLAFGRAILHEPQVLLLVDPFANCDETTISLLSDLMLQLAEDGVAILILADNDAHLERLCDTIYNLDQGRIIDVRHPAEEEDSSLPFKIPARLEGSVALVNPADIFFAMSQDGRTYLQTSKSRLPTQFTMAELEERLARSGFFRAHRGYLVNLQHVTEIIPFTRNSFSLRLDDPEATHIPLSKTAAGELKELLGY